MAITLYLDLYAVYEDQLHMDIRSYKAGLEQRKAGLKELLGEVQIHRKDLDDLDRRFNLISRNHSNKFCSCFIIKYYATYIYYLCSDSKNFTPFIIIIHFLNM